MRPVTDSHNVSRCETCISDRCYGSANLHYCTDFFLGSSSNRICEREDGFSIFIRAIPYNYYAILTIIMMVTLVLAKEDYGPMKAHEKNAIEGDLFTTGDRHLKIHPKMRFTIKEK